MFKNKKKMNLLLSTTKTSTIRIVESVLY